MGEQFIQILVICAVAMIVLFLIVSCFIALEKRMVRIESLLDNKKRDHFDPKVEKLVDLAVDHWRLKRQIENIKPQLTPADVKRIDSSLRRIENYLRGNDIDVTDYTGRLANDGLNVDIISVEQDSTLKKPIIKESIVPAVSYKGSLRKKSQVVVLDNSQSKEQKNGNKKD